MATQSNNPKHGNLPLETTAFIGRSRQTDEVLEAFGTARLVTLTGPGGIGKTRIALRAAARTAPGLAQGAWLVELSPVLSPDLLEHTVAGVLGVADQTNRPLIDVLSDYLRDRELLLVLDTCEHLVKECAELARALLAAAPGLRVLATSRQALDIPDEHRVTVGPMETGPEGEAAALLRARAWPDEEHAPQDTDQDELARLCALLDGVPLAIELAAGLLRATSADHLIHRLDERLNVLSSNAGTEPPVGDEGLDDCVPTVHRPVRHSGLRTTIGWSHEWCTPQERLLWARLSVFPGGFDARAVDFVCSVDPLADCDLTEVLDGLVAKSVLLREGPPEDCRYRLLDTVREYGAEWLDRLGESDRLRLRHRDYYRLLAHRGEQEWIGPDQAQWQARTATELPNLRAALDTCLLTEPDTALEMASDLVYFWFCCGHLREGRHYTEAALALAPDRPRGAARALWSCGMVAVGQGDLEAASRLTSEARALAERHADEPALAGALCVHASALTLQGAPDRALPLYEAAHEQAARTGPRIIELISLPVWGYAHLMLGDADGVRARVDRLKELTSRIGEMWAGAYADYVWGNLCIAQGRPAEAIEPLCSSLEAKCHLDDLYGIAVTLDSLALAATGDHRPELAARIFGLVDRAWNILGTPHLGSPEMTEHRRTCESAVRTTLSPERFTHLYTEGADSPSIHTGATTLLKTLTTP
ncbi:MULTISPECIES: NB-ARC domain-containing protein [unclassified Streptomyces]|uniref:ATP-binding protein n=1 Tax=unclassified Streptomyces TaxID=2593676 RepID=UPI000DB9C6DC|nr:MULTISPECIES: NB-ARC domain-containing protein [unclassified Streptomyces]MYT72734.1 regulator [Streptomyces sp. SID8367]RAJ79591.1 putative ATPase [Streptomyces sp. PsTaAH-137]